MQIKCGDMSVGGLLSQRIVYFVTNYSLEGHGLKSTPAQRI